MRIRTWVFFAAMTAPGALLAQTELVPIRIHNNSGAPVSLVTKKVEAHEDCGAARAITQHALTQGALAELGCEAESTAYCFRAEGGKEIPAGWQKVRCEKRLGTVDFDVGLLGR